MANPLGGFGETIHVVDIQKMCDQVKPEVEERAQIKYVEFKAVKYRRQLVHGENFLIKVHVGGVNYIHLLVFRAFDHDEGGVKLTGVQQHKTKEDPLEPFNN
ncbi:leukocyte cysteine proteinase inhibitor 1-like [Chaetodon auriga]|uniref:leukocyte cysteine proteinase inhibitor 1-like n=1 Tax=Chaetodon auriga TaxID=39042 RepID=UPI0040331441